MGQRIYQVRIARYLTEWTPWWDGCTKAGNGSTSHRTIPIADDTPCDETSEWTWDQRRARLPAALTCAFCGEQMTDLPPTYTGWDKTPEPSIQWSGDPIWKPVDGGVESRVLLPGMIWDDNDRELVAEPDRSRHGRQPPYTGDPLRPDDLAVPLTPDPRIHAADGSVAKPRSMYGWQYVTACRTAGVWLPQWHVVLPTSRAWLGGYRMDAVFPCYMNATNGTDMGNGYGTGWDAPNGWLGVEHLTLTPSIFFGQGSPNEWHAYLTDGVLG